MSAALILDAMEPGRKDTAITGLALRFPGAAALDEFWRCLAAGKSLITEVPAERWEKDKFFGDPAREANKTNSIRGGFIEGADSFDAAFFNISRREAIYMDPQQRIVLELAWQAIEDAGYKASVLQGAPIGVFIGVCNTDYTEIIEKEAREVDPYIPTGTSNAILSNRVSYFFDFKGPSITIDTACASSLAAIHQAVRALENGDCETALAGAVNLCWSPRRFIALSQGGMLSREGKCKAFDSGADGYVRGEGGAVILLKPLDKAIRDGDHIYALIKGTGLNHGGRTNSLTVTNPKAQAELITAVYTKAGISPDTVSCIETHGPGTPLGDPIEIHGLKNSFSRLYKIFGKTPQEAVCGLGSVKTNIGHLESAAGIAGVLKIAASMLHKMLPASINFQQQNPLINLKDSPFYIIKETKPWDIPGDSDDKGEVRPRRAGVSSFGFGGTNAHIIMEEYIPAEKPGPEATPGPTAPPVLIPLSAKNPGSLHDYAGKFLEFLKRAVVEKPGQTLNLRDIAYTLQIGREAMEERAIFAAADIPGLMTQLAAFLEGNRETVTGKWEEIAASWLQGGRVDWESLFYSNRNNKPRRISLPVYSFARERYWLPGTGEDRQNKSQDPVEIAGPGKTGIKYCREYWAESNRPPAPGPPGAGPDGRLVIFDTGIVDTGETLFDVFRGWLGRDRVILVKPGERYREHDGFIYEIDPRDPGSYRRLAGSPPFRDPGPARIIHAWARSGETCTLSRDQLARQMEWGIYSLFYMSRALMEQKLPGDIRLVYVYPLPEAGPPPQYAALSGFARTIRQENPKFKYKILGIQGENIARFKEELLAELAPAADEEIDIRFIQPGGKRQVKRYKEIPPPGAEQTGRHFPWKENGVYLISGGAGGLGRAVAKHIAARVKANLVLTGRSPLTPRIREQEKEIETLGSRVLYIPADVSKREDVSALMAAVKSRYREINGVIHAAGVLRDSFILKKTPEEIGAVLAPKVYGTIELDEATREENLDFFIMFSALAGVMGNAGQGDYAYANRFMDGYAETRERLRAGRERRGPTISIAWPYWQEGGMPLSPENRAILSEKIGGAGLSTAEGIQALEEVTRLGIPHCILTYNSPAALNRAGAAVGEPVRAPVDPALLFEKTGAFLEKIFADILKLPANRVKPDISFEKYGVDSIMIQMFNVKVEKELGPIPRTLLFQYRNLKELTGYFVNNYQAELGSLFHLPAGAGAEAAVLENPPLQPRRQAEPVDSVKPPPQEEEIAVIGIGGRYPMAKNLEEYWQNLETGKDCITEIPVERWDYRDNYDPDPEKGKIYCKWGGFLEDIDKFDSLLFNISPREAEAMDPQERIFLETARAALEDAGYSRKTLHKYPGEVGVFAGVTTYTYHLLGSGEAQVRAVPRTWSLANRVSYVFDFHGPSIPVDTACSSSLTAIHLACESLRKGECATAVAGGVNLYLHPSKYHAMCLIRMLSAAGKCHTFGEGGDGMVPGEGVGAVVLKKLAAAVRDNDHIYAVIKSSSINHGGRTNGYTVPDPGAQAGLILSALAKAKINPRTIGYIEAHGTGTVLGDPIEIAGLTKAFREYTPDKQYCAIGSAKSNIGHLESAAGIAGLTKVILQLKHKKLVPSLHAGKLNPNIDFAASPFFVQRELSPWKKPVIKENGAERVYPRRAGISSFGAGGSNTHLIVEEYEPPAPPPRPESAGPHVVLLSAGSEDRLKVYAARMIEFLESDSPASKKTTAAGDIKQSVTGDLVGLASEIIGVEAKDIDPGENMVEYGFDPVKRMELARQIDEIFRIGPPPALSGEIVSLEQLSQYLCENYKEILLAYYGKNSKNPRPPDNGGPRHRYIPGPGNIAYTLQVGREEMDRRLALVVSGNAELKEKLNLYCRGKENIEHLYCGNVKTDKQKIDFLMEGEEGVEIVNRLLAGRKVYKLARLWVSGVEIDWERLYSRIPGRVSLPVYPFEKQGHWLPEAAGESGAAAVAAAPAHRLHPLVGINTSTLEEQQFTTRLTGEEFYLADHVVAGRKTLPGAAYIEMARAAGQIAGKQNIRELKHLIWARPIVIDGSPLDIHIRFHPRRDLIDYEVGANGEGKQWIIHARGKLSYENREKTRDHPGTESIDIKEIKTRCGNLLDAGECYRYFQAVGLDYGDSFRTIRELYYNEGEALSVLRLPRRRRRDSHEFGLHPSLMDGAFQTVMGLIDRTPGKEGVPYLPFMLGEVESIRPLPETCFAYVTANGGGEAGDSRGIQKFDIRLADESGQVLVKMKDFSIRAIRQDKPPADPPPPVIFFHAAWKESAAEPGEAPPPGAGGRILLLDGGEETRGALRYPAGHVDLVKPGSCFKAFANRVYEINPARFADYRELAAALNRDNRLPGTIIHLWSKEMVSMPLEAQLEKGIYSLFYLTRAIMEQAAGNNTRLMYVYPARKGGVPSSAAAAGGFARTIRLENPKFIYKTIEINDSSLPEALQRELRPGTDSDIEVRYHRGKRSVKEFAEIVPPVGEKKPPPLKEKGVYLVSGGTGGLGLIFAEYLAKKAGANLILVGRSGLNPQKQAAVDRLKKWGADVLYVKADVSHRRQVENVIREAKRRFDHIHGVIHAAGVIRDAFVLKKTKEEMDAVLAPKVYGTAWLDEATKDEPLDFFVLFSSVSGVMGNIGQSDYAYANSFMDRYAENREKMREKGERRGKTLSIAWPLWKHGGMTVDEQTQAWMEKKSGAVPLETVDGLEAFEKMIVSAEIQAALLAGHRAKLSAYIGIQSSPAANKKPRANAAPVSKEELAGKVEEDLLKLCEEILKIKKSRVDPEEELGNYGLDSIMMMTMLNRLEAMYGQVVEPYVLAEHNTLRRLASYLIARGIAVPRPDTHGEAAVPPMGPGSMPDDEETYTPGKQARFLSPPAGAAVPVTGEKGEEKIAVIGMACRFPGSNSLEAFWENLVGGRDLISEVPADRWEISRYYSPDKEAENKTYCKWGGFLDNIYFFDAGFFGITGEDARVMDPYHRILLELSEELFCRAGISRQEISGTGTGVYIGGGDSGYSRVIGNSLTGDYMKRLTVNKIPNMMAARVSDFYNLRGPSLAVDTACSSALVAIHQACRAIRGGDCHMAVAGGIELIVDQNTHIEFSKARVLSADGVCYVFDERAGGFVPGEGAGLVLLKSYEKALTEGDEILAVILGSAVNNDGHTMGLTVPGQEGQKEVIKRALDNSGISPRDITCLEAHGTGTLLGDPIEIRAATEVYREYTPDKQYCAVGSVKSNMGHLLRAAAIPGFIKVILAMLNRTIPPTLNCTNPHPRFKFAESPFYPVTTARPWNPRNQTRAAAISSFGFGGTNCHMILEEFTAGGTTRKKRTPLPLPRFKRKYYCLGRPEREENAPPENVPPGDFNEAFIMEVLEELEKGNLTSGEALQLI